jgi:capsular polysaccharide biosynthesis protein
VIDAPLYRPNWKMNAAAGFALGALLGALAVLALEWMAADILASAAHVERILGVPVLGTIPAAGKK